MRKVKVSCVSYLNSTPFVYGIRNHRIAESIELSLDNPADSAQKLKDGVVDIGLIPVAAISTIPDPYEVTQWCIGANGPVQSVALFSDVPLDQVKKIYLDFQSVTSNMLTRILAANFWKIKPEFEVAYPGFEQHISGNTAGVVIGDRALQLQNKFKFTNDLAGEWYKFTGLPFVFARWVFNKKPDPDFILQFNDALRSGIENMDVVISQLTTFPGSREQAEHYLKNNLSYQFDDLKKQGMVKFLEHAKHFSNPKVGLLL